MNRIGQVTKIGLRANANLRTQKTHSPFIKLQVRNAAQHFDIRTCSRQWPRFPKFRKNFVPDDDVIFSAVFFWFIVKKWMLDDSEPPNPYWQYRQ